MVVMQIRPHQPPSNPDPDTDADPDPDPDADPDPGVKKLTESKNNVTQSELRNIRFVLCFLQYLI